MRREPGRQHAMGLTLIPFPVDSVVHSRLPVFPAKAGIHWAGGPGLKQTHLETVLLPGRLWLLAAGVSLNLEKTSPQATGNSRPVSDACLMVSMKRCRSTATSNVGRRFRPVRTASANRVYIWPTLKGSPRGKSDGT